MNDPRTLSPQKRNLTVIDGRHAGYPGDLFVDASHLEQHGAAAFTTAVADALAQRPAGARWISLPSGKSE